MAGNGTLQNNYNQGQMYVSVEIDLGIFGADIF
jgi:hypothetical protein